MSPLLLLAFSVFCSQAVPSYSKVRKKTKFRIFLGSLWQFIYNSAINSTSQRTPLGKSLTATQLLAGFEVKYVP